MTMIASFVSAAYVIKMSVDAVIAHTSAFQQGYAAVYRNGSETWGYNLGIFELVALGSYQLWAFVLTVLAIVGSMEIWNMIEAREVAVKEEGLGGTPFDAIEAMKFFVLEMIVGLGAVIGGYCLGDVADKLITWFDEFSDNTDDEGRAYNASDLDPAGTAARFDVIFHYVTHFMGLAVFTTITLGAYIFGAEFLVYKDELDCSTNVIPEDVMEEIGELFFGKVTQGIENCYENIHDLMGLLDHNKNGFVDRCEDYQLLKFLGNTEEYSMKYSRTFPTPAWATRCN